MVFYLVLFYSGNNNRPKSYSFVTHLIKFFRIIAYAKYNAHIGPIVKSLFLLEREDIYRSNVLKIWLQTHPAAYFM